MARNPTHTLCLWLCLLVFPALSQSIVRQADRQFDLLAYSKAADLYEQALQNNTVSSKAEIRATRAKLGYSYRQVRDMQGAERVYRELIAAEGELPDEYVQSYLYFAQALASNGKYQEAQEAYEKYNSVQKADTRGPMFSRLYRDVSVLSRNAGNYKVDFLSVNSTKAEFSPILYKDGLVFVSAQRNEGVGLKRVFNWNNTPFLDLYYMPEPKRVEALKTVALGGSKQTKVPRNKRVRYLGKDDYTPHTSNDSRTVGYFGGINLNEGLGYGDNSLTESARFSQSLNTKYHEGPATFSRDGSRVIFTRNNYTDGKYRESSDGINKLKLYTAQQINGDWKEPEEIAFNSNEYSTGHPALGRMDQLLYFVSDMPGGFGGTDVYVARWEKDHWGRPVNLGATVNTKGNELFPFLDEKENLYFASDGHAGLGDLDLFYAPMSDDGLWAKSVQNLGEPINSNKDDFGIVTDGERKNGYFSSNRKNGGADDDIYRFKREGSLYHCRELVVAVVDAKSKVPLPKVLLSIENADNADDQRELKTDSLGNIRLCLEADNEFRFRASTEGYIDSKVGFSTRNLQDDQPTRLEISIDKPRVAGASAAAVGTNQLRGRVITHANRQPIPGVKVILRDECDGSIQETITGEDGYYLFATAPGCDYTLEAMKDNMGTLGSKIRKEGSGAPDLVMFRKGDVIKIDNIYYDLNKFAIRPNATTDMDKLVQLMKKYPAMKIEMRSHTDSRASAKYNKTLSTNRARAAVAYLKKKGIKQDRLTAKGCGEEQLVNRCKDGENCSEEEHQQNRRTEIKILAIE